MAERSIAAVLKTVEGQTSGGSNPSFSADESNEAPLFAGFLFSGELEKALLSQILRKIKNSEALHLIFQMGEQGIMK